MPPFRRRKIRSVRAVLEDLGFSPEEIEEAELAGTDELLAIDGMVLPERGKLTIDELAAKAGVDIENVRVFWRALGFVDPVEDERSFNKRDVAILKSLVALTEQGLIDPDLGLQVARVVGVSMAQVATAVVDGSASRSEERQAGELAAGAGSDTESLGVRTGELLPFLSEVVDYTFRRHLRAAARRRVAVATSTEGAGQVVGFADLVRFTELSLQLDEHELARLIGRFDELVNAVVIKHGGRIVKMIGDAVMFTVVDPMQAALIAIELSTSADRDEVLSGLRIGMASGHVLARDGDLYGPVVNLASRLGEIGRGGAVNVSQEVRDAVAGDKRFALRSLGKMSLRHIGVVRVYRLRPSPAWTAHPAT